MAVYNIVKDCNGCKVTSGKQADHNHFILDSEEYEKAKVWILFLMFISIIVFLILYLLIK